MGRLSLFLSTEFSVHNLEEAVRPDNFQRVLQEEKKSFRFQWRDTVIHNSSLALKMGHTLHRISHIIHCQYPITGHEALIKSIDTFKKSPSGLKWCFTVPWHISAVPRVFISIIVVNGDDVARSLWWLTLWGLGYNWQFLTTFDCTSIFHLFKLFTLPCWATSNVLI